MKRILSALVVLLAGAGLLWGCSGKSSVEFYQPTSAVLTLSSSGTPTTIYGIDVTIVLPAGVTVKSASNPPETDGGVVTATGSAAGSLTVGVYTAASGTIPGTVRVMIANAGGFNTGEFGRVNCDIAFGHRPQASDFSLSGFVASDPSGTPISGITTGFTADIK